jgi:site-specific recombinase XerD
MSAKTNELGQWLQRFLREHLSAQRNLSAATIAAYRDTFRLLVRYLWKSRAGHTCPLLLDALTPATVVGFLDHLEHQRGNGVRTRNARLAAIRSFVRYLLDWLSPDLPPDLPRILSVPFKRQAQRLIGFLSRQEVDALLAATDDTWTGRRDHLLFLLLYNTGARISEILALRIGDVDLVSSQVRLMGKGRKQRRLPLWPLTQRRLRRWLKDHQGPADAPLLPNRFGQRLSRAGAAYQLRRLVRRAAQQMPTLKQRQVSPHTFRHSTAMAMLEADVPIEVIALYLGHESPKTTHPYVEASLSMKQRALAKVNPPRGRQHRFHPTNDDLRFLDNL